MATVTMSFKYPGKAIKPGTKGEIVSAIQQQLNVKGFGPLKIDDDYGSHTTAAIQAFQAARHLPADGITNKETWDALFGIVLPSLGIADVALQVITSQIGQNEIPHGSNSGPMVNQYLKSVGLNPGYAWCQALVYWSYNQAATKLSVPNPVLRTAGVMDCWARTAAEKKISAADAIANPSLIKPGYQMILDHGKGMGHTGLVESMNGITMATIEGNSNNNGSRDGEMVVRQTGRTLKDKQLKGFIKY
jgi:Putative peptidoglycan binding domain/CHAP domain